MKAEITRLARKEVKREVDALRRSARDHRAEMSALRKVVQQLVRDVARAARSSIKPTPSPAPDESPAQRFSAKGFGAHRRRLKLSAADFARLLGTSAQTVYNWESGKARPRAQHMETIAEVRKLGKREAAARLGAG